MVGLFKALLPPLLLATFAAAQNSTSFSILTPSASIWWVAQSENVMSWDCKSPQAIADVDFTILIQTPTTPPTLPLAIIAIQKNDACTITVSHDKSNQAPGTGYVLLLANTLNNTDVYATSQPFEIKALGSLYPSQVSSSASAASGTDAASSSATASSKNSASLGSHSPSFLGLTGIMGLLTVAFLGA